MTEQNHKIFARYDSGHAYTILVSDKHFKRLRDLGMLVPYDGMNDLWTPSAEVCTQASERNLTPADILRATGGFLSMKRYPTDFPAASHYGRGKPIVSDEERIFLRLQRIAMQLQAVVEDIEKGLKT